MFLKTGRVYEMPEPQDHKDKAEQNYPLRRQEIIEFRQRIHQDQQVGLAITGAIWAWLITKHAKFLEPSQAVLGVMLPIVLAGFFLLRCVIFQRWIRINAEFIRVRDPNGWEEYIDGKVNKWFSEMADWGLWLIVMTVYAVFAILFVYFVDKT